MLTKSDEQRLAAIIDTVKSCMNGESDFSLNFETQLWLANKLKDANRELKRYNGKKTENGRNTTVTVRSVIGVHLVAIWNVDSYECIFWCDHKSETVEEARSHGRTHIQARTWNS